MSSVIDLLSIDYGISNIYIAIKIEKKKNENKSNRMGKYLNVNPKRYRRFLYLLN